MITATFDLLLLGYDTPILLSPIHFLCLVDPLAQWFKMWTVRISRWSCCVGVHELICSCFSHLQHGQFSRRLVLKAMSERPGFVSSLTSYPVVQVADQSHCSQLQGTVSHVMSCRMRRHGRTYSKHHTNDSGLWSGLLQHDAIYCIAQHALPTHLILAGFYNESSLHHLLLCHSLSVLERLLLCVGGRKLFPVTARGRQGTSLSPFPSPLTSSSSLSSQLPSLTCSCTFYNSCTPSQLTPPP